MSDCRFGVSPVNISDPDPDSRSYTQLCGLTNKRQEETKSDKKRQEHILMFFFCFFCFVFFLLFKCYILINYDIRKVSNIILWPYNL